MPYEDETVQEHLRNALMVVAFGLRGVKSDDASVARTIAVETLLAVRNRIRAALDKFENPDNAGD